jgi:hypothetical protein
MPLQAEKFNPVGKLTAIYRGFTYSKFGCAKVRKNEAIYFNISGA